MQLTPDEVIVFSVRGLEFNATIVNTWLVMGLLVGISIAVTRNLRADVPPDRWRTALELIVMAIQRQIEEVAQRSARHVMYFAGTLFLMIALSNLLLVIPGFSPPTSSLSTTVALALSVLIAVPLFGIQRRGLGGYLKKYIEPSLVMLPFNIIGEFSRGISLALRLYGNVMSGAVVGAILLGVAPFFFPVLMDMLGLLTGLVQAYIFAILATVYIASATTEAVPSATASKPSSPTFRPLPQAPESSTQQTNQPADVENEL